MTKYRTIIADPPWEINRRMGTGGRRANATEVPYDFMDVDAIKALPVEDLADDGAHLFLWTTRKNFREGIAADVARAWGFEPVGEIVWGLRNPGMGSSGLGNDHEPVLVARRGNLPFTGPMMGVWFWRQTYEYGSAGVPQKVHSAKPTGFHELVEQASPGPYLELFARTEHLGWDTWGNESLGTAEMAA